MVDCQRDIELETERSIHRAIFGSAVGRRLDGPSGTYGPWCICHIELDRRQHIRHVAFVRECSSKESFALNERIAEARIVLRYVKSPEGEAWALAYD